MHQRQFEYCPIARGVYIALLWLTVLVIWLYPQWLWHHVALLLFLGFVLRPLLEASGLVSLWQEIVSNLDCRLHRKRLEKRRRLIERRERDKRYRYRHSRDPRLPKNW